MKEMNLFNSNEDNENEKLQACEIGKLKPVKEEEIVLKKHTDIFNSDTYLIKIVSYYEHQGRTRTRTTTTTTTTRYEMRYDEINGTVAKRIAVLTDSQAIENFDLTLSTDLKENEKNKDKINQINSNDNKMILEEKAKQLQRIDSDLKQELKKISIQLQNILTYTENKRDDLEQNEYTYSKEILRNQNLLDVSNDLINTIKKLENVSIINYEFDSLTNMILDKQLFLDKKFNSCNDNVMYLRLNILMSYMSLNIFKAKKLMFDKRIRK